MGSSFLTSWKIFIGFGDYYSSITLFTVGTKNYKCLSFTSCFLFLKDETNSLSLWSGFFKSSVSNKPVGMSDSTLIGPS